MNYAILDATVQNLFKIPLSHVQALKRLGIQSIRDLCCYAPKTYISKLLYTKQIPIKSIPENQIVLLNGKISDISNRSNKLIIKFTYEPAKHVFLMFFKKIHPAIYKQLYINANYTVEGKISMHNSKTYMIHPEFVFSPIDLCLIEPVYPLTYGLNNKTLWKYIKQALDIAQDTITNTRQEKNTCEIKLQMYLKFLNKLHIPKNVLDVQKHLRDCLATLAIEELTAHKLLIAEHTQKKKSQTFTAAHHIHEAMLKNLNFELTCSQTEALDEIQKDQANEQQMVRLLQADVGSGKTIVALMSMVNVTQCNYQAALMAPTELLANQHYQYCLKALNGLDITVCLLTGSLTKSEQNEALQKIKNGASIVIGTHSIFQSNVSFKNLKYVVIDEQHRFGVYQRLSLIEKSNTVDILLMSATPIPRSLAATLLGNVSITNMKTILNRKPVNTYVMSSDKEEQVLNCVQKTISKGEKVFWVCPLISDPDEELSKNTNNKKGDVQTRFKILQQILGTKVAMLHGDTPTKEKQAIMSQFLKSDTDVIVSTTIIEVGIDIKNASLIIVESANQFGLAQLHQLRGRVGRSSLESHCILMYNKKNISSNGLKRLALLKSTHDCFILAKQDLEIRGSGDILGIKQSGKQDFYFADKIPIDSVIYETVSQNTINAQKDTTIANFYKKIVSKKFSTKAGIIA
ncbi:ATP-dependent DNA helicase RecG [Candidatus Sneabacter namystus]|uniref:ATP-dependent DNA helicase RecG n=1 Tax=Candidatus Sneabacter namystus TaxID=2601646 RepID=A0A5C0UH63_9RICK|nr:ATP-dependent DNA helicase RecG [Candidatus Sneabacter namystus]QEK39448.1 ATP-dependent DNA helicase RecG [Candidatus Sneabacter namystus]